MNKLFIIIIIAVIAVVVSYYFIKSANKTVAPGITREYSPTPSASPLPSIPVSASPTLTATPKVTKINKNGVSIEILQAGSGVAAKKGDKVTVNYVGTLQDGTKFDSSIDRGIPFVFNLGAGEVISGWDIGVEGMKVGEKIRLTIPPALAYGVTGVPGTIPANATLIFEVELLAINK
jgi:FKBP-type peptidyl-prolyl cis-trans isomerase